MKAFVTYLKKESPAMQQLASGSTGWLELPNGQRRNPSHQYKFNARSARHPWWFRFLGIIRGRYGD